MSDASKKNGYTTDELRDLVILGLQQPGSKISEIKGTGAYVGSKTQIKYQELPIWHSKPEIDKFILKKVNVPESKLKEYPSREDGRGPFYMDVARVMTQLRKDREIIDWNVGSGIWRLVNTSYLRQKFPEDGFTQKKGLRKYWIYATSEKHWDIVKKMEVWASENYPEQMNDLIKKNDIIIFYESRNLGFIRGIYEVNSEWKFARRGIWTDEDTRTYNSEIDLKKIKIGNLKFHDWAPKLEFCEDACDIMEPKQRERMINLLLKPGGKGMPSNGKKNISETDYQLIFDNMIDDDEIRREIKNISKDILKNKVFEDKILRIPNDDQIVRGLQEIRNQLLIPNKKILEIVDALSSGRHILLAGPIGTGKTRLAQLIPEIFWSDDGGYLAEDHTATSDWNTQDVIGGIFPKINEEGEATYSIQNGCVVETVQKNWEGGVAGGKRVKIERDDFRDKPYNGVWLIIDEFNRADIDKAFGQLFTSLRTRKLKIPTVTKESYRELDIPKDFRIIGTLNTQDKHFLFELSDALKSRFAYIEIDIPEFEEKEKEMYYAANKAITDLELDQKRSGIQLNHNTKKIINSEASRLTGSVRLQTINEALETAYTILDYVREFKKLGTVILILMFKQIFVSSYRSNSDMKNTVENALMTNLIPQLENLSAPEIGALISLCRGENGVKTFIQKSYESQNKQSYFKTMHLINNITNRYGIGDKLSLGKDFENNELILETLRIESVFPKYELPRFIKALEDLKESMIN